MLMISLWGWSQTVQGMELQGLDLCSQNVGVYQSQLEQSKLLFKLKMSECQHQESLIENLIRQQDALQAQQEAFLEQVGFSCYLLCWGEDNHSQDTQRTEWGDNRALGREAKVIG